MWAKEVEPNWLPGMDTRAQSDTDPCIRLANDCQGPAFIIVGGLWQLTPWKMLIYRIRQAGNRTIHECRSIAMKRHAQFRNGSLITN